VVIGTGEPVAEALAEAITSIRAGTEQCHAAGAAQAQTG
jgi:hypothetical protein